MDALWQWIEATAVAARVRESAPLTAILSAVHLLGFTLVTGGALVANLRLLGLLLRDHPALDIVRPAARGVTVGLMISVSTGFLLFAPRAADASANAIFQLKMLFLAVAVVFHLTLQRTAVNGPARWLRALGGVGLVLWIGVAMAGAAFILLEGT